MKFSSVGLLAYFTLEGAHAYLIPQRGLTSSARSPSRGVAVDMGTSATSSSTDISIPYDAAAKLAYNEWLAKYDKPFNAERYEVFKENYKAITVLNVSEKKKARESSSDESPNLLSLNEYADCTAEEYMAIVSGDSNGSDTGESSTGDILGEVVAAAESQMAASSALQDAAEALAEEEQKLATQLGLDSVEELEIAIDEMEGISEDGTTMESDNLAREARVRSAYLEWCKEYNKSPEESRFPQFYDNYLEMEEFANESRKEMVLNEYADFTEEEYAKLTSDKEATDVAAAQTKADTEAAAKAAAAEAAAKGKADNELKEAAEKAAQEQAIAKRKAEEEQKLKERAEAARLAAMTDAERRQEIEKEKAARRSAQEKELQKAAAANEAAAIAAAAEAAEKEAQTALARRKIEEEAYNLARAKAKEWEEKQAKLVAERQPPPKEPVIKAPSSFGFLGDLASKISAPIPAKEISPKKVEFSIMKAFEAPTKTEEPKKDSPIDFLAPFFSIPGPAKKTPAKTMSPPAPKPAAKLPPKPQGKSTPRPTLDLSSIFQSKTETQKPKSTPAAKPPSPVPLKSSPRPTLNLGFLFESKVVAKSPTPAPPAAKLKTLPKIDVNEPVTGAFASVFGSSKKTPAAKSASAPTPIASKSTPKASTGFFGRLSSPSRKAAPGPTAVPAPNKPADSTFSFFKQPETKKVPGSTPAPKKSAAPPLSLFKPAARKVASSPPPVMEKPATPKRPTLSLFGSKPAAPKEAAKPAAPQRPTLSLFRNSNNADASLLKKAAQPKTGQDNIPVLSKWTQNADGSITGFVSNSKSFRSGTRITTSPVRMGAKSGTTVKTGSGSRYRLN